ncbi:MAG TPA: Xaa-Pro peptidase family protein [Nocardioidaceae bacterium]|nr:Xaa-Pro peptidase family protein [Nocardioidaceae bacterium]
MIDDLRDRLARAQRATGEAGIDAILVSPGPDLRYLTGYDAKPLERLTCLVVPADGDPSLVVPRLERPAALASPVGGLDLAVIPWDETDDPYALAATRIPSGATVVAVDNHMWAEKVLAFRTAMAAVEQRLANPVIGPLRLRKTPDEVAELRRAGAAIDSVHANMSEWLRPGRTELEVGNDIADAIVAAGHAQTDFVIVGSGPNAASPHHELSDRVIQPGEPVVVDIGGSLASGYCSDSTRTYIAGGEPPEDFVAYYAVLQSAQATQCDHVRPGVSAESVDAIGRTIIEEAGYGDAFFHRTGHGIGLETHEEPYIVVGNTLTLETGMAFSVEPGIYLDGRHGARIEDIVVVTDEGVERLNNSRRDLTILPG